MAFEYKVMGKTVRLEIDPNTIAVRFRPDAPRGVRAAAAISAGVSSFQNRLDIPSEGITLMPAAGTTIAPAATQNSIGALSAHPDVQLAMNVYKIGENKVVASKRIMIGLKDRSYLDGIVKNYSLSILRETGNEFVLEVGASQNSLEISQQLEKSDGVVYSEPDFITVGHHLPRFSPSRLAGPTTFNSAKLPDQYAMNITQAKNAWELVKGTKDTIIAILDEGVDTSHPDLSAHLAGAYDGDNGDFYQQPNSWDGHGTCCAGLAAADGVWGAGVCGSGLGCGLMAIRIAHSTSPGSEWITSNDIISQCIDWSWKNGASVLSNSWGGGAPSNAIGFAFERARTQGRAGLGCVIVIAAGNSSGPVQFPATLPHVVAVSASNEFDEFKTINSRDGENWWGSCFGPEVSIAAPGVHNVTTDVVGTGGYDPGNYYPAFNGTSSATPIVAGACGLALSTNNKLREDQVREALFGSADKVGVAPYLNGRNDFFGAGRVNVLKLVQAVRANA